MSNLLVLISAFLTMASCGSESAPSTSEKNNDIIQEQSEETTSVNLLNGVNDSNTNMEVGNVNLSMKFGPRTAGIAYLYSSKGSNFTIIDSAQIVNAVANFGTDEYESGFYLVSVNKKESNMASFIINPIEQEIEVSFPNGRLENQLESTNSKENQGWAEYHPEELKYKTAIKELKSQQYKSSSKAKFTPLIEDKEQQLFDYQKTIIEKYPNTFLAKYVSYRHNPYQSDIDMFWSDIDANDESLIHTNVLSDRVQDFMIIHSGGTESGFINCVDRTKASFEGNPRMLSFMLYTMLDGFYKSGKENVCYYIYDNYIIGDDCGTEIEDFLVTEAEGVMNLYIGKTPPNIVIAKPEQNGNINLYEMAENNEYTLIFYWASWCHKCEQEIPVLNDLYKTYQDKGFEIFGVSVDMNRSAWLKGIEDKDVIWPNGSDLNQWKGKSALDYKVTKTPTLFLLDKDKKIVLKPKRIYEVKAFLQENL